MVNFVVVDLSPKFLAFYETAVEQDLEADGIASWPKEKHVENVAGALDELMERENRNVKA